MRKCIFCLKLQLGSSSEYKTILLAVSTHAPSNRGRNLDELTTMCWQHFGKTSNRWTKLRSAKHHKKDITKI